MFVGFFGAIDADAFAAAALSLALYALPHLLGNAEALAAASFVARAGIGPGQRFVAYRAGRGLASVASGLVEVTGEVARGAELKVALGTPVLGIAVLRRVLRNHPRAVWFLWRGKEGGERSLGRGRGRRGMVDDAVVGGHVGAYKREQGQDVGGRHRLELNCVQVVAPR